MQHAFPAPRTRRRRPLSGALIVVLMLLGGALHAQTVRGVVRDSTSQLPVAGVVVSLLDSAGASVARTLSSERGLYFFATRANATDLRVQRIGYRASTVALPNTVDDIITMDVVLAKLPTLLAPIKVVDKGCARRADEGAAQSLLDQARTGLLATVVARKAKPSSQLLIRFERRMEGTSDRISSQAVRVDSVAEKTSSFESARSAVDFVARGFTEEINAQSVFHAPDADVLLNDDFVAAYCFELKRDDGNRRNQVGLAFHSVRAVLNRVDVDGALWIDTVARAIRGIEFRYKGLPSDIMGMNPGGTINFREMTSGVVLIDRWTLRLVGLEPFVVRVNGVNSVRNRFVVTETGGELARAVWSDGFTWNAPPHSLLVHATDGKDRPAAQAMLRLANTNYGGTTDANGNLQITNLTAGPYRLVVLDKRLSAIGLEMDTPVSFVVGRDSVYSETVRVKTAEEYVAERCGGGRQLSDSISSVLIAGRVTTDTAHSVDSLRVSMSRQTEMGRWVQIDDYFLTGPDGLFFICSNRPAPGKVLQLEIRRKDKLLQTIVGALSAFLTVMKIPVPFP
ncbi:MAG: carboxypeptidase regulatory-like domain-containing protein [Gemmatimonas sp.]